MEHRTAPLLSDDCWTGSVTCSTVSAFPLSLTHPHFSFSSLLAWDVFQMKGCHEGYAHFLFGGCGRRKHFDYGSDQNALDKMQ
jgi:hypothetical protein